MSPCSPCFPHCLPPAAAGSARWRTGLPTSASAAPPDVRQAVTPRCLAHGRKHAPSSLPLRPLPALFHLVCSVSPVSLLLFSLLSLRCKQGEAGVAKLPLASRQPRKARSAPPLLFALRLPSTGVSQPGPQAGTGQQRLQHAAAACSPAGTRGGEREPGVERKPAPFPTHRRAHALLPMPTAARAPISCSCRASPEPHTPGQQAARRRRPHPLLPRLPPCFCGWPLPLRVRPRPSHPPLQLAPIASAGRPPSC